MELYTPRLIDTLDSLFEGYAKRVSRAALLLSGGIDSSVAACFLKKHIADPLLFSMGTASAKDKPFVDMVSSFLHMTYTWVFLDDDRISACLPRVRQLLVDADVEPSRMQLSLAAGYYLIFERIAASGIRDAVTGQGPDILLAGYHKYKAIPLSQLNAEIARDMELLETDKKRDSAMAKAFGITLFNPYLSPEFIAFTETVPPEFKIRDGIEKFILREAGKKLGLPAAIVSRPKKAFQYSTGLEKTVTRLIQ